MQKTKKNKSIKIFLENQFFLNVKLSLSSGVSLHHEVVGKSK